MKAAFFDLDGTLTGQRVWSGLLDYFRVKRINLIRYYAFLVIHYGLYVLRRIGAISQVYFRSTWAKNLSWQFKGFTQAQAYEMWEWVIENRISEQWRLDIVEVLKQHKSDGYLIFIVSGGPVGLIERIVREVGGDYAVGTRHQIIDGIYSGRAEGEACQGGNKPKFVLRKIKELNLEISLEESYAYADSFGDVQFLTLVGHPVAVYPDDELRKIANRKNWKILGG